MSFFDKIFNPNKEPKPTELPKVIHPALVSARNKAEAIRELARGERAQKASARQVMFSPYRNALVAFMGQCDAKLGKRLFTFKIDPEEVRVVIEDDRGQGTIYWSLSQNDTNNLDLYSYYPSPKEDFEYTYAIDQFTPEIAVDDLAKHLVRLENRWKN